VQIQKVLTTYASPKSIRMSDLTLAVAIGTAFLQRKSLALAALLPFPSTNQDFL
jgi:hypothetical protein